MPTAAARSAWATRSRGTSLGNSVVAAPDGSLLLAASDEPTLLIADCWPGDYGASHPEGTSYLSDRRTDLYGPLAQSQAL